MEVLFGFASYKESEALLASAGVVKVVVADILVDTDAADASIASLVLASDANARMNAWGSILEMIVMTGTVESEKDWTRRFRAASLNTYVSTEVTRKECCAHRLTSLPPQ